MGGCKSGKKKSKQLSENQAKKNEKSQLELGLYMLIGKQCGGI